MARFTDRNNVEWTVDINITTAKRVRTVLGVDLFDVADGSIVERIIADPVLLCDRRQRDVVATAVEKIRRIEERATGLVMRRLETIEESAEVQAALAKLGGTSTGLPASSA